MSKPIILVCHVPVCVDETDTLKKAPEQQGALVAEYNVVVLGRIMEVTKILESKKTERIVLGIAVLFCFLVHIVVLRQFTNWYSGDVMGYLSHAATFSGRDWSGVMRNVNHYFSWGYSVLLTIPMLFTSNITVVYHCAVLFNAVLSCGILLLCYGIGKRIVPQVNRFAVILCATAVSVYTSYVFQGAVMLSEIFLYFLVFVDIYCLLRYIETERNIWGILTGLAVGYTYIIHNRAVAVVIAFVMVVVAWCIKEKSWKKLLVLLLPLICMLLLNIGVNNYLDFYEKQGNSYTINTYESQVNKLTNKKGLYSIISLIKCALGECWYALIGSFGMIGIGLFGVLKDLFLCIKKRSKVVFFYVFILLMIVGTLAVSILFLFPRYPITVETRYDIYIYGRYWETVLGVFILYGFLMCFRGVKNTTLVSILGASTFLSVVVEYMTYVSKNNGYNYWAVPAVLTTFFEPERKFTVVASSIVGILLMALLFYWVSHQKKCMTAMSIVVWMCFCIFTGYNSVYGVANIYKEYSSVINMPTHNQDFNNVYAYINENSIENFAVCTRDEYVAVSFQVMRPDVKVTRITEPDHWVDGMGTYIIDKATWGDVDYTNTVYENETFLVYRE